MQNMTALLFNETRTSLAVQKQSVILTSERYNAGYQVQASSSWLHPTVKLNKDSHSSVC